MKLMKNQNQNVEGKRKPISKKTKQNTTKNLKIIKNIDIIKS